MSALLFKEIKTDRLLLRQFLSDDAPEVKRMAGDYEVAKGTLSMPHPYEDGAAEEWIAGHGSARKKSEELSWAICLRTNSLLIGAISLMEISSRHNRGELGYWIGQEHWNHGYCSEATTAILDYSFNTLKLHKIFAEHFASNPASGRVMEKAGMSYEGTLRSHVERFGEYQDVLCFGILSSD